VKSVNGRFLELRFHLPKEYAPYENDLRSVFSKWTRGTVDIYIHRKPAADSRLEGVKIRANTARYWAAQLRSLAKSVGVRQDLTLRDILQMPMVLDHQDRASLLPGEMKLVESHLKKAVARAEAFRMREGVMLKKESINLLKELETRVDEMTQWRDEAMKSSHQRLKSRLTGLENENLDASRLALETALLIDKMDVHEEVVRLREHIKACRQLVLEADARGKKLDFYCQELLREVNTIGSKSQLSSLTQAVVDAKSLIEKFREQVQNIE
jgi:uncharacterized protein (TIGR00255 family)